MARGMDDGRGGLTLDQEQLAESAYRVYKALAGERAFWEGESIPTQDAWLKVGQHAETLLGSLEGSPYESAGFELMVLFLGRDQRPAAPGLWGQMPAASRLVWEAVARHLTMVLNCDDVESLEEAESLWAEWFRERAARKVLRGSSDA